MSGVWVCLALYAQLAMDNRWCDKVQTGWVLYTLAMHPFLGCAGVVGPWTKGAAEHR